MRDVQAAAARAVAPFMEQLSTRTETKAAHDGTGVTEGIKAQSRHADGRWANGGGGGGGGERRPPDTNLQWGKRKLPTGGGSVLKAEGNFHTYTIDGSRGNYTLRTRGRSGLGTGTAGQAWRRSGAFQTISEAKARALEMDTYTPASRQADSRFDAARRIASGLDKPLRSKEVVQKSLSSTASAIKEMTAGIRGEKHLQGKHPQKTHGGGGGGGVSGGKPATEGTGRLPGTRKNKRTSRKTPSWAITASSDGGISGGPPSSGRTGSTRTPKQDAQITSEMARSAYGSASRGTKKKMESHIKRGDGQYKKNKFDSASSSYRKADSVFQASVRPSKPKKRAQFALYD